MSKIDRLRQRIGAFDFTEPLNKNNELGRELRRKRLDETQPHIGRGEPYKRKGRYTKENYDYHYKTYPQEPLRKGTRHPSGLLTDPPQDKSMGDVGLEDPEANEATEDLHGRKFGLDDPEKFTGEELREMEEELRPDILMNYTTNQPAQNWIHGDMIVKSGTEPSMLADWEKVKEEQNYVTNPQHKIKPIKPTRMEWRAIISAKQLRQRIAQVRLAYAGPPQDVINAFRNKEALKMHAKSKKGKELSFQTDGETLFQSGYPIAQHTETGINFSYQGHPSASTAQAGRMLGINTFHTKGKYYINGSEVDPTQYDYTDVPFKDIQEGTVKVNKNIKTVPMTPEKRQLMKDQDYFSTKARRELKDPETGEIYDQVVVQPEDQEEINRVTGLDTPLPEETFATEIHHGLPKSKAPALRRSTAGAVALSPRSHQEAHFPERFVKRSLKKARLKIARMRQRNISRGVPRIAMGALARNVMQKARGNPFFKRGDTPVGYVYDEDNDVFLDATKRADAKAIRKKHGKEGQWLGINSITDTREKKVERNNAGFLQIERELDYIEDVRKNRPVLGGYENSLEASYPVIGDEKNILDKLKSESVLKYGEPTQKSSLGIDPQGTAYILYPDGKRDLLTQD